MLVFSITQGTLQFAVARLAANFVGELAKLPQSTQLTLRAVREISAQDEKCNCCRHTNYLIRWTQANQLSDQLTITGGEGDKRVGY